jgi:hypothetical protein
MRNSDNTSQNLKNAPDQWAQIAAEIIDKLIGTNTSTSFKFDDLEIDIPRVSGPDGSDLGSINCVVNGKIQLTTTKSTEEQ